MSIQVENSPKPQTLTAAIGDIALKHGDKIFVGAAIGTAAIAAIALVAAYHLPPAGSCLIVGGVILSLAAILHTGQDDHKKKTILTDIEMRSVTQY